MKDKNLEEYVIIRGKKFFVHNNELSLGDVSCRLSEIEKLDELDNLEVLNLGNNTNLSKIENLENLTNLRILDFGWNYIREIEAIKPKLKFDVFISIKAGFEIG